MRSSYNETYTNLYHGTTEVNAISIISSSRFIPSEGGWCGPGVYFYDSKAKAWWSANRSCRMAKSKGDKNAKPAVVVSDFINLVSSDILDLRSPDKLYEFGAFVDNFLGSNDFIIVDSDNSDIDEFERTNLKRAMLLRFYCEEHNIKLVIGDFKQHPQPKIDRVKELAEAWLLAIGIETIYCAIDSTIIDNIRVILKGGNFYEHHV